MKQKIPDQLNSERYEKYRAKLQQMRLMDDDFMTEVFMDKKCAELLLRIILGRTDIFVKKVQTQQAIHNFGGKSVRLDMQIEDSNRTLYNVEIQRSDHGSIPQRARYNSNALDSISMPKGKDYEKLSETYVIFITEHDIFHAGFPLYHVERIIIETGNLFYDGAHILYVNSQIQNNSPLGRLMHDFYCENANDMFYEVLRKRTSYFKEDEEGVRHMCRLMEELANESRAEGRAEGRAVILMELVKEGILTKKQAAEQFGSTYEQLLQTVALVQKE